MLESRWRGFGWGEKSGVQTWWDGWLDGLINFLTSIVDTVNTKAKQYQEYEILITRIEVRITRLKGEG